MPLIRCPQCSQAYDIPPAVAVRLPVTVANCSCGFWLCGDREKLLQQLSDTGSVEELDVTPFKVDDVAPSAGRLELDYENTGPIAARPRHLHIVARGSDASIDTTFTITDHPLWIGRKGCHIEFDDTELSLQHCAIEARGSRLIVRDAGSHNGTFLDGEEIGEAEIGEGVHLLRVGRALLCLEPVTTPGRPVEPVRIDNLFEAPPQLMQARRAQPKAAAGQRLFLRGVAGPATGKEFDLELATNTVGREGSIRVPDEYLSRQHFEIFRDDEGNLRIRDLGSRNGTFLNTLPARNTKVTAGDEIRAGMTVFRVEAR